MAAKKDKMIPSEKERKRALKYATPAGTGRMWVTMGIAFIIFGIILLLIPIGLVISEASAQRYDPESIHTATLVFYLLGAFFGFCGCLCVIFGKLAVKAFAKILCKGEINYPVAEYKTPKKLLLQEAAAINQSPNAPLTASTFGNWIDFEADWQNCLSIHNGILQSHQIFKKLILVQDNFTKYTLTETKLIIQRGCFNLREDEIQLYRVRDIAFKQNFYERLCRVGSIHLCSTDAMTPEIDIRRIKNPRDVKEVLSKTIEACRKANGIRTSEIIGDHGRFPEPAPHGMPPEPCHEHPYD